MLKQRHSNSVSVFVSTAAIVADEKKDLDVGEWFDLTDFDNKTAFIVAATLEMSKLTEEKAITLHFSDIDAPFDTEGLFSKEDISEQVWDLIDMEDHNHTLLWAYRDCFGADAGETVLDSLSKAEASLLGYFDDTSELITNYLETSDVKDSVISTILPHINKESLAATLMIDIKECNNHYFQK